MTRTARPALAAAALVAVLLAGPAAAYTIVLKDGSQIVAQEKYRVAEGRAHILLPNGTRTFLRASEIDVERTERANQTNLGSAVVLEGEVPQETPPPAAPRTTLGDLIQQRPAPPLRSSTSPPPATAPAPAQREALDSPLADRLATHFREHDVQGVQVLRGAAAGTPLVTATTPSEAAALRALAVAATAFARLRQEGEALPALELAMTTPTGEDAGSFLLTPEAADELLAGRVDIGRFYVDHVRF